MGTITKTTLFSTVKTSISIRLMRTTALTKEKFVRMSQQRMFQNNGWNSWLYAWQSHERWRGIRLPWLEEKIWGDYINFQNMIENKGNWLKIRILKIFNFYLNFQIWKFNFICIAFFNYIQKERRIKNNEIYQSLLFLILSFILKFFIKR